MQNKFIRKRTRIPDFDYGSINYYFITIITKNKEHYFGRILQEEMYYSNIGCIALNCLKDISKVYDDVYLDDYVIKPNHMHFIIAIDKKNKQVNISKIIQQYKGIVTKMVGFSIWHKSFYDHVIRNEKDYLRIYRYIEENVLKWSLDDYYSS